MSELQIYGRAAAVSAESMQTRAEIVREREQVDVSKGIVLWFTGLSGSGKTTLAHYTRDALLAAGHPRVECLDGDELRTTLCRGLGFSREDRLENVRRVAFLSKMLARNGVVVLVSLITPYEEMREYCRSTIPEYTEIYVRRPLELCERVDVKGLYAKARRGELSKFTGISDPYDEPLCPELIIDTAQGEAEVNGREILELLEQRGIARFDDQRVSLTKPQASGEGR